MCCQGAAEREQQSPPHESSQQQRHIKEPQIELTWILEHTIHPAVFSKELKLLLSECKLHGRIKTIHL